MDEFRQLPGVQGAQSGKNKKKKKKGGSAQAAVPQRYIPGLNSADDDNVIVPLNKATKKHATRTVPTELVEDFLEGKKNPISALTEYAALQKLIVAFEECAVERPSIVARFASTAKVNGKPFPQGVGKTKKDAKTAAAKVALTKLLGLESEDVESHEDKGKVVIDAYGRKMIVRKDEIDDDTMSYATSTASSKLSLVKDQTFKPQVALPKVEEAGLRPLWDQPKNPVSSLTEYCTQNDFKIEWKVSAKPTDFGYRAEVWICDDAVAHAFDLNKKDAKKAAALKALEIFSVGHKNDDDGRATVKPSKPNPRSQAEAELLASAPLVGGAPLNMPTYHGVSAVNHKDTQNIIERLQEFCKQKKTVMEMVVSDNPGPNGLFEACVSIENQMIAAEEGGTKKEAKRTAAEVALGLLMRMDSNEGDDNSTDGLSTYDKIAQLSHLKLHELLKEAGENPNLHKYMSAFVVKRGSDDRGTVVALGTGNAIILPQNATPDGRSLNDCHSVVIARRALLKYFHKEMKMFYDGQHQECIFERSPDSSLLKLKDGVSIHLYMSRAPCGDATILNNEIDGELTAEMLETMRSPKHQPSYPTDESGFTASKAGKGFEVELASEQSPVVGSMCCSDKIMKWNVVGLQGSLYSHYLKPVFLTTVSIGSLFDHGHLSRALCCRLTEDIGEYLTGEYRVNHVNLGRVTTCNPSHAQNVLTKESINWSLGDEKIEIVDPASGKSTLRSPFRTGPQGASRLAKAGFLFRYRDIARASNRPDLFKIPNYKDVKHSSADYQAAKATLREHLEVTGFGFWTKKGDDFKMFAN